MANGTYGIRKPAIINASDVDIFYSYRPTRGSEAPDFKNFKKLNAESVLNNCKIDSNTNLSGLYNLRLPLNEFSRKGIYTIYIVPKTINIQILDVSTLTGDYANVRGVVFSLEGIDISSDNGSLVGYRMEFLDGENPTGEYRIITSSNKCEAVSQNVVNSTIQKGVRYRFNDSSNIVFCTVTPSTAPSFKSTSLPFIGKPGDMVNLVNTKFNPVMIEVEMVNHDIDTVSTMLEGAQVRNLDNGIITTFDEDGNIYHQAAYGNIVKANEDMHADFKIPYTDTFISSERGKFEEISNQVNNG